MTILLGGISALVPANSNGKLVKEEADHRQGPTITEVHPGCCQSYCSSRRGFSTRRLGSVKRCMWSRELAHWLALGLVTRAIW
jgi:hypothetical protein